MNHTLQHKVAVITGGNSGIGLAAAKELVAREATVLITGRRKEAVYKAAAETGTIPFIADQASLEDIEKLKEELQERFGKIDILFINAGITGGFASIADVSVENFDSVMNINFRGAYFTLSKLIPLLSDGASVVILSSIVAATYHPNSSVYQASKAALNSIAKTAAAELASRNIRVNIISPGPHKTEVMKKAGLDATTLEQINDQLVNSIPLKKMGDPADIAKLVAYLSGPEAGFITGSEIIVDGGMML
ncbi:SDR family oxidoreductase [Niabella yanshanensis]|uniref:SDR family oxidoreductase n=1 Tax=Niabella yanshanensis TaxID=577386 RepID=A0ABZ0W7N5_9BACT|nr:SDR family oxidoreductase [Niabella yanshanensis]WQD38502.1 SDR family oxidoreductase [Niabella yanshanensis]